ncbi:FecR domain-containing protein [Pseudomonas syringae]|nr:FecR domain-containing protein [Pseudomonas syringae]
MRILSAQSMVEAGDTVSTQGKGYAQIRFSDDSQLTLQPDTVVTLNTYVYDASVPTQDQLLFTLKQGGIRSDVGKLGQRSRDRVTLVTPAASIALQSASVVVQYRPEPKAVAGIERLSRYLALTGAEFEAAAIQSETSYGAFAAVVAARYSYRLARAVAWLDSKVAGSLSTLAAVVPASGPGLAPGLYVQVIDGLINLTNRGGTTSFAAGQFGYTPSFTQPPVIVPASPALVFTPPPAFSSSLAGAAASTGSSGTVDCEVR